MRTRGHYANQFILVIRSEKRVAEARPRFDENRNPTGAGAEPDTGGHKEPDAHGHEQGGHGIGP